MNVFLDALSDAWGQMTGTLAFVARAFGENWQTGLAALIDRPAALFYVVGIVAGRRPDGGDVAARGGAGVRGAARIGRDARGGRARGRGPLPGYSG